MSSILIVGAGELGTAVLRALALSPKRPQAAQVTVLLRPESLASPTPAKKQNIDETQSLRVKIQSGDFITASVSELAAIFGMVHNSLVNSALKCSSTRSASLLYVMVSPLR